MATDKQIQANRKNARKSTGPRTEEGKARSSQNALKHGLLARDAVFPGEDPAEFDQQLAALDADIRPANSLEFELVRQIADAQWRMRPFSRLETGLLAAAVDDTRHHETRSEDLGGRKMPGSAPSTAPARSASVLLGSAMLHRTQALVHLARYDGHLSRRFHQAIKQLSYLRDPQRKRRTAEYNDDTPYRPNTPPPAEPIDDPRPYNPSRARTNGGADSPGSRKLRNKANLAQPSCSQQLTRKSRGRKSAVVRPRTVARPRKSRRLQSWRFQVPLSHAPNPCPSRSAQLNSAQPAPNQSIMNFRRHRATNHRAPEAGHNGT